MEEIDIIRILKRLVQFPTENPPGKTKEIINFLVSEVFKESDGFTNEIIPYKKKNIELHNLVSKIGTGPQKVILSGHLDVVPAGNQSLWRYPPFSAEIEDGKLYGRGACDMKAGITMLIGTIMNLKKYPELLERYTILFLGSADEEAGMTGAYTCVRKGVMKDAILLIVAEPTNMKLGIAEKGLLWMDLYIRGKAAHASIPGSGLNSIEGAIKLIPYLYECLDTTEDNLLGKSSLNIGKIEGGVANNIVPEETKMSIDYRLIPKQDTKILVNKVKELDLAPYELIAKATHTLPAVQTELNHLFIQNLKQITNSDFVGLPYATDTAVLINPKRPIPFLIYGPGDAQVIHRENEYVEIKDLVKCIDYLTKAIIKTYL